MPKSEPVKLPPEALSSDSLLGSTRVANDGSPDPRYDADLASTPDWMSRAILDQRAAQLSAAAEKFLVEWELSGYTLDELTMYAKTRKSA
jgi:hypothetical protein